MDCKLLAIDMDDTLLKDDLTISDRNKAALIKAENYGVKLVLCTGRAFDSVYDYACELGFNKEESYCICNNGATLYNIATKKVIYEKTLPMEYAHYLIDFASNYDIDVQLYIDGVLVVEKLTPRIEEYISTKTIKTDIVGDLRSFLNRDTSKVLFNSENTELKKVSEMLASWVIGKANMFFSKPEFLEFTNLEADKGKTLIYLASRLSIAKDNVVAIGDSYNDIYMIKAAGYGVAVNNAYDDVKKEADLVLPYTNEEDAIAELIEKYIITK